MPPSTTRQMPPKPSAPPLPSFPTGSLLAGAVPVTSLREDKVTVAIYGRNRSGKTSLAAQFPKPLLFVSCEPAHCGAVQSVSNMEGITLIHIEPQKVFGKEMSGRQRLEAVAKELAGSNHYKTVVLKTATSLQDLVLEEMKVEFPNLAMTGKAAKDTWGMRANRLHDTLRAYLDLKKLMHVVIISQEKDHNPPRDSESGFPDLKAKLLQTMQEGSFMAPALGAANAQWLYDNCGYMMQLYEDEVTQEVIVPMNNPDGTPAEPVKTRMGTGKRARHLRLQYHPNFAAGGKWQYDPNLPEFVTAPDPQGLYNAMAAFIPALKK